MRPTPIQPIFDLFDITKLSLCASVRRPKAAILRKFRGRFSRSHAKSPEVGTPHKRAAPMLVVVDQRAILRGPRAPPGGRDYKGTTGRSAGSDAGCSHHFQGGIRRRKPRGRALAPGL